MKIPVRPRNADPPAPQMPHRRDTSGHRRNRRHPARRLHKLRHPLIVRHITLMPRPRSASVNQQIRPHIRQRPRAPRHIIIHLVHIKPEQRPIHRIRLPARHPQPMPRIRPRRRLRLPAPLPVPHPLKMNRNPRRHHPVKIRLHHRISRRHQSPDPLRPRKIRHTPPDPKRMPPFYPDPPRPQPPPPNPQRQSVASS